MLNKSDTTEHPVYKKIGPQCNGYHCPPRVRRYVMCNIAAVQIKKHGPYSQITAPFLKYCGWSKNECRQSINHFQLRVLGRIGLVPTYIAVLLRASMIALYEQTSALWLLASFVLIRHNAIQLCLNLLQKSELLLLL